MGARYSFLFGLVICAASRYLQFCVSSLILLLLIISGAVNGQVSTTTYDCSNQRCGDVSVTYPFTIVNSTCPSFKLFASDTNFTLNCTKDHVLYLGNMPVLQILDDSIILNLRDFKATYMSEGICDLNISNPGYTLTFGYGEPYISAVDNQFGSFGCSTGFLFTFQTENATAYDTGGCEPVCGFDSSYFPTLNTSSYSGCGANLNCCISNFPAPARVTQYSIQALPQDPTPCDSFAVPFHPNYTNFQNNTYGYRVHWALPDPHVLTQLKALNSTASTFNVADLPANLSTVCSPGQSSQVIIVNEIEPGYRCSCLPGYRGDGYLNGSGCVDIDECSSAHSNNSCVEKAECRNSPPGSYTCHCKSRWRVGDGKRDGMGCPISPTLIKAVTVTGGVMGLMLLLLSVICANVLVDRKRKRQFFRQNGGFELQAYIAAETGRQTTRFFTARELRDATQNFSEHLKLGTGGFGTIYKGRLEDGRLVAVKKANQPGDLDRSQFLNELAILTQIHHRNIVRLYGCCFETANPLLVYELVSKGDLAENLASEEAMGWAKRLLVATEVADALAYLHAKSSPPILHRGVKTANILLDNNLDAKVADFGISRLIPEGEKCVSTVVQGTLGYLDPEYFQTLELTDKSDVYSLGVVLVELITGLKAVDTNDRGIKFANLALFFLKKMEEERLHELVDERLEVSDAVDDMQQVTGRVSEANSRLHTSIQDVAMLAERCLALRGVERPSMSELANRLLQLTTAFNNHGLLGHNDLEELRPLVSECTEDGDLR